MFGTQTLMSTLSQLIRFLILIFAPTLAFGGAYTGFYTGTLGGAGSGWFLIVVDSRHEALALAWDDEEEYAVIVEFTVAADGSFSQAVPDSGTLAGTFTSEGVVTASVAGVVSVNGTRLGDSGPYASIAGLYEGIYDYDEGPDQGALALFVAPNGQLWFFSSGPDGDDAGAGTIDGATFEVTSVFSVEFEGGIVTSEKRVSGTFENSLGGSGVFSADLFLGWEVLGWLASDDRPYYEGEYGWTVGYEWIYVGIWPWIYVWNADEWLYISGPSADYNWVWHPTLGWSWTSALYWPWIWSIDSDWQQL